MINEVLCQADAFRCSSYYHSVRKIDIVHFLLVYVFDQHHTKSQYEVDIYSKQKKINISFNSRYVHLRQGTEKRNITLI